MKKFLAILLCSITFGLILVFNHSFQETLEPSLYLYMIQNFLQDTDSKNAVASILLNYRMYDTMFEALILLTAIIGMQQFLPRSKDMVSTSESDTSVSQGSKGSNIDESQHPKNPSKEEV